MTKFCILCRNMVQILSDVDVLDSTFIIPGTFSVSMSALSARSALSVKLAMAFIGWTATTFIAHYSVKRILVAATPSGTEV